MSEEPVPEGSKRCPWCKGICFKDENCNYVFACGFTGTNGSNWQDFGCGRPWCWFCERKFCGKIGPNGQLGRTNHDRLCCRQEPDFKEEDYCPGGPGHDHCEPRWQ